MRRGILGAAAAAVVAVLALVGCQVPHAGEGVARYVSSWTFVPDKDWLGGFSGLDSPDGTRFAMISDRGYFVRGRWRREDGRIADFESFRVRGQKRPAGMQPEHNDSEGLVWDGDELILSREGIQEVWRFAGPGAVPERLPRHPDFAGMRLNGSLEALARDPSGALVTMNEIPEGDSYQLYRLGAGGWRRGPEIPAPDGFRAVGADYGPDGWLYLLERRHALPLRFASRVRRLRIVDREIVADETLLVTRFGRHDNLEGITVWPGPGGDLRLTMVSDDNFLMFQRTEFVEYAVPAALDPASPRR